MMKVVHFNDHILVNDGDGGISRIKYPDAKKLALLLNNHFALKARYERANEIEDEEAKDAGPRKA